MRIALAPLNPTVGDFEGNMRLILDAAVDADAQGADLLVLPEMVLSGYPPRDLLLNDGFVARAEASAQHIAANTPRSLTLVLGTPWQPPMGNDGSRDPDATDRAVRPTNALLVIRDSRIVARYDKRLLPDYDIFDEPRYFRPGSRPAVVDAPQRCGGAARVGLAICEDLWRAADTRFKDRYTDAPDPLAELVGAGVDLIAVANASPFIEGKAAMQSRILADAAHRAGRAVASVNLAGANDDLVFDAHTALYLPSPSDRPRVAAAGEPFDGSTLVVDAPLDPEGLSSLSVRDDPFRDADANDMLFHAITTGIRDYCRKTAHPRVTLGISGGIDSALVATLAAAALGPDRVLGVRLPSRFSSEHSLRDAEQLAQNLGVRLEDYAIEPAHGTLASTLGDLWRSLGDDTRDTAGITEENIQSRIRGLAMMAISNKTGRLLLTTGNKSEHATGYATLYGDQNGGLAPIADLLKTEVFALARHLNTHHERLGFRTPPIPENTISKPPSAELRHDQTDQDTLPPYDTLDAILSAYIDERMSPEAIAERLGHEPAFVDELVRRIDRNEHKRFQLCVAIKLRARAFGPGRRHPIVQRPPQSNDRR